MPNSLQARAAPSPRVLAVPAVILILEMTVLLIPAKCTTVLDLAAAAAAVNRKGQVEANRRQPVSTPSPRARAATSNVFPFLLMMPNSLQARAAPSPRVLAVPAVILILEMTVLLIPAKCTTVLDLAAAAAAVNRKGQVEANRRQPVSTPSPRARDQASLVVAATAAVAKVAATMMMTATVMMTIAPALAARVPRAQANRKGPRVLCSTPSPRARDQASLVVAVVERAAVAKVAPTTVLVLMMILVVAAATAAALAANRKVPARARDLMPLSLKLPKYPRVRYCTF